MAIHPKFQTTTCRVSALFSSNAVPSEAPQAYEIRSCRGDLLNRRRASQRLQERDFPLSLTRKKESFFHCFIHFFRGTGHDCCAPVYDQVR